VVVYVKKSDSFTTLQNKISNQLFHEISFYGVIDHEQPDTIDIIKGRFPPRFGIYNVKELDFFC
jgi:hypothetical protein